MTKDKTTARGHHKVPHLDRAHGGPEDGVVELDATPVLGPGRAGQVEAVLLQDAQGCEELPQGGDTLIGETPKEGGGDTE